MICNRGKKVSFHVRIVSIEIGKTLTAVES